MSLRGVGGLYNVASHVMVKDHVHCSVQMSQNVCSTCLRKRITCRERDVRTVSTVQDCSLGMARAEHLRDEGLKGQRKR